MNECTESIGNEYYDYEEITLGELFGHIFDRFRIVLIITLVFTVIGVGGALLLPRQYEVSATVRISTLGGADVVKKYGGTAWSKEQQLYELFSRENIENAIAGTPSKKGNAHILYEDVEDELKYENVKGTDIYRIYIDKTSDTEYWTEFILNLVDSEMTSGKDSYITEAEKAKNAIEKRIAEYEALLTDTSSSSVSQTSLEALLNLKEALGSVEVYIDSLDSSFEWITTPEVGTENKGTGKAKICILFFLLGGVIGVIVALAQGFSDKHIYSSKQLKKIVDGKLVSSIPLYRKSEDIDSREFVYIAGKLSLTGDSKLSVVSLSSKAGDTTVAKGIEDVTKAHVENLGVLADNPKILSDLSSSSLVLVVLRAGIDDTDRIGKIIEDFAALGIKDYGFILNCVDVSDNNVIAYLKKDKYSHHRWLIESWKNFYSRNY